MTSHREHAVTTGNWLLTFVITAIPVLNIIMLLVWSFGSGAPASKRNWARAQLIVFVLVFVITGIFYAAGYLQ